MGFAQHFFLNSNSPKNKFAPAEVSGGAIHRLGETVVQILSQTPYQHNFSHELLISVEFAPNDVGRCCADCPLGGGSA